MSAGQCSVLSLSFIMCLVSCSVGKATQGQTDERIMFYVFGSENIYIIDPKSQEISSTIGPDGVCTKSNNRYSRWACLNNSVCRNFSHASPKIWLITMWIVTLLHVVVVFLSGINVPSVRIQWWETNLSSSATCLGIEFTLLMYSSRRY